jgi:hypothetical protein
MSEKDKLLYQLQERQRQLEQNKEAARKMLEALKQQLRAPRVLRTETAVNR